MAISDAVKSAPVVSGAIQGNVAKPVDTVDVSKTVNSAGKRGKKRDEYCEAGANIRVALSEAEKQLEGSKSDKVAFLYCLGNPAVSQKRVVAGNQSIDSFRVEGYAFKALEPLTYTRYNLKPEARIGVDVDRDTATEVQVGAGEVFYLNLFEAGALISRPEYAGSFSGEGQTVNFDVTFSEARKGEPLPILKKASGSGSIKEGMIEIATMVADPNNPNKKVAKVKDEFADKFAVLFTKKTSASRAGSAASRVAGENAKNLAAAFNAYINKKN